MMYNYPYPGFTRRYYRYPGYYYSQSPNQRNTKNENISSNSKLQEKVQKETSSKSDDDVMFEIFGIKLHFDDILLICLIFFLYNEGVQDEYLFIALILLLLS